MFRYSLICLLIGVSACAATENLVKNGDFSITRKDGVFPDFWQKVNTDSVRCESQTVPDGKTFHTLIFDLPGGKPARVQTGLSLKTGRRYRLKFQVKAENLSAPCAASITNQQWKGGLAVWAPKGTYDWRSLEGEVEIKGDEGASYRLILFARSEVTGKLAFRDIEVSDTTGTGSKKPAAELNGVVTLKRLPKAVLNAPLPALRRQGKPFFPLGAYDTGTPRPGTMDPGFLAAGGNIAFFGGIGMPGRKYHNSHEQPALFAGLEAIKNDPQFKDIALIVELRWNLLMDDAKAGDKFGIGAYVIPAEGKALAERKQVLADAVKKLSSYPNVIGYTMDEPENLIWPYYKEQFKEQWKKDKDASLINKMKEWISWTTPIIQENHPGALRMPILAWWTSYESCGDLFDVLMPDEYPYRKGDGGEFTADLYTVSYDAAKAVRAARIDGGGRTVVYMPPMFDNLTAYHTCTLPEQRYVCFAPITRGVMGILGWRLGRCSEAHRKEVIYPVMRQIHELSGFLLGEWHDELVSSDHDSAGVDYLRKFQERIRLMAGEEDGEQIAVLDGVPDVSYCLRRHADGRWLLLAVNNRRAPLTVKFSLKIDNMPSSLQDTFDGHQVEVTDSGRALVDKFAPFGVHAYIFETEK